jgi:hypothetical protein
MPLPFVLGSFSFHYGKNQRRLLYSVHMWGFASDLGNITRSRIKVFESNEGSRISLRLGPPGDQQTSIVDFHSKNSKITLLPPRHLSSQDSFRSKKCLMIRSFTVAPRFQQDLPDKKALPQNIIRGHHSGSCVGKLSLCGVIPTE